MVQTGCLKLLTENHISEADDIASPDESLGAGAKISSRDSIAKGLFGPARTARARKPMTVVPLSGTGSRVPNITRPTCPLGRARRHRAATQPSQPPLRPAPTSNNAAGTLRRGRSWTDCSYAPDLALTCTQTHEHIISVHMLQQG